MVMYSHFKKLGLLYDYRPEFCINLRPYYIDRDGWRLDCLPMVIKNLQKIRFFNRFDFDLLSQMITLAKFKI